MSKVEKYTKQAINIADDNRHGYSQYNRWGNPDYDCSSLVITVVQNAGIPVKSRGATYTGNMYTPFIRAGFKNVTRSINLSTGSGLRRGDVLLTPGKHTEIYIGNGRNVGARISEKGTIHGAPGDQTGREIRIDKYYNYPWIYVLRYPEASSTSSTSSSSTSSSSSSNYLTQFARDVRRGRYGNGAARRNNIYRAVQREVNNILAKRALKNDYTTEMARDVLRGRYGNGAARKDNIYRAVQNEVNKLGR